jgi:glutaredoxin
MKSVHFYTILVICLIVGLIYLRNTSDSAPTTATTALDTFSKCLSDAGATFYGAYWCPHCQDQKELLQHSTFMPYVECSTPDGKGQLKVCSDLGITGYPTWIFKDGTQESKLLELSVLGEKTGCALPE